jgi:hypothetical protein
MILLSEGNTDNHNLSLFSIKRRNQLKFPVAHPAAGNFSVSYPQEYLEMCKTRWKFLWTRCGKSARKRNSPSNVIAGRAECLLFGD